MLLKAKYVRHNQTQNREVCDDEEHNHHCNKEWQQMSDDLCDRRLRDAAPYEETGTHRWGTQANA